MSIKKVIGGVRDFFKKNGVDLEFKKVPEKYRAITCTHRIYSNKDDDGEQFAAVVYKVFPEHVAMEDGSVQVKIDEDFIICRECGCSWLNACPGGCWWVEPNLCSSCEEKAKEVPA